VKTRYTFVQGVEWASIGCSCCESTEMVYYNSDDTDPSLGTASSEGHCYQQALITAMGRTDISDELEDAISCLDRKSLLQITENLGIIVEIIEEEE